MSDTKPTVSTTLRWDSPGGDPIEDIRRVTDRDKQRITDEFGCIPKVYQAGFDAVDRLVKSIGQAKEREREDARE